MSLLFQIFITKITSSLPFQTLVLAVIHWIYYQSGQGKSNDGRGKNSTLTSSE
jgi:hypothetical protein